MRPAEFSYDVAPYEFYYDVTPSELFSKVGKDAFLLLRI